MIQKGKWPVYASCTISVFAVRGFFDFVKSTSLNDFCFIYLNEHILGLGGNLHKNKAV